MRRLDLAGEWRLEDLTTGRAAPGRLPGQNYPDLIAAGLIDDPFWGANEAAAQELAGHDFRYRREFDWAAGGEKAVLGIVGLDTFAEVELNGRPVLRGDNAFRTWRADVTGALVEGRNEITITFASPLPRIAAAARRTKLRSVGFGAKAAHARKPQCHFGWDWGPNLPPVGVTGSIMIEVGADRLADVRVAQDHLGGGVNLTVGAEVESAGGGGLWVAATLLGPDGEVVATAQQAADAVGDVSLDLAVARPQLWWPNGLGGQPLYRLTVALARGGDEVDRWEGRLGLRTIELDQPARGRGRGLRFRVNGHPIFAKGADWIPSDTFITRTGRDRLERLIAGAARANMNMLRVWGGGYYESDDFYDLCDQYGVLVWQDCAFACSEYPLAEPSFVESVEAEVRDNVRRLRHHASLALWCGNNEVFMLLPIMGRASKRRHQRFFFETLAGWIRLEDPATPYWPGSPAAARPGGEHLGAADGDSHLWQVWHGMRPIEALGAVPAQFCSEFGLESMPARATVARFTDVAEPALDDPVMEIHQKSVGGNQKILYYILSKYPRPSSFDDLIYLSQLIQAEAIREAVEGWRRATGRSNGALYWQYNDVWPTASWASIDSELRPKALQFRARHFFAPVLVSITPAARGGRLRRAFGGVAGLAGASQARAWRAGASLAGVSGAGASRAGAAPRPVGLGTREIHAVNDRREAFSGTLLATLSDLSGRPLKTKSWPVELPPATARRVAVFDVAKLLGGLPPAEAHLEAVLTDQSGRVASSASALFVPDRLAALADPGLETAVAVADGLATITLRARRSLARHVMIECRGLDLDVSDNFFDLPVGPPAQVTAPAPDGLTADQLAERLVVRCLNDVPRTSRLSAALIRARIQLKPVSLLSRLIFALQK